MTIKLIVGLANFGKLYQKTRHNVGSWYIYLLAMKYQSYLKKHSMFCAFTHQLLMYNRRVMLLVPQTYINLSGEVIKVIADFYKVNLEEIMVVHDELDLLPGSMCFQFGGRHAGHNGLKSIIHKFHSNEFYRLRIGIGRPTKGEKLDTFVLSRPTLTEYKKIMHAISRIIDCTDYIVKDDIVMAMNKLNTCV